MRGWAVALLVASLAGGCLLRRVPRGEVLMKGKCSACHTAPAVSAVMAAGLDAVLLDHQKRVKLSQADREDLRSYLLAAPADGGVP